MSESIHAVEGYVTPEALRLMMRDGDEIAVLDARGEDSFSRSHLLFATCLPLGRVEIDADRLLPRRAVRIVWCDDGSGLAEKAASKLRALGYAKVFTLKGGIAAWQQAGHPLYSGVHVPSKAFAEVVEHECGTPAISAEELERRVREGEDIRIFDSRPFEEYHTNTIPGATSIPGAELVYRIHDLVPSPDTFIVVNCGGRTRSIIGAQALINADLPNHVASLRNGTMGWHLAGFDVSQGAVLRGPAPSPEALTKATRAAERIAKRHSIEGIDMSTLRKWQGDIPNRTLYVLDVRSPEEYEAGHLPGAVSVAGGQLVQETDNWLAVWGARVVVVDDVHLVRARVTASWLAQMGWSVVTLAWDPNRDPVEKGAYRPNVLGMDRLAGVRQRGVTVEQLSKEMTSAGRVTVVDVGSSKNYKKGHIPGAVFVTRVRLAEKAGQIPPAGLIVVTSEDGALAQFAAAELADSVSSEVKWLRGGTQAWAASGLKLEQGAQGMLEEPDDVWYAPRERGAEPEDGMREYLDWEVELVNQIARDPDSRIRLVR